MSPERRLQAAEAFWRDDDGVNEHAEAIAAIAQKIKFRPKSVIALPVDRKAKYLIGLPAISELVAARLLVAYHIAHQRPMMAAFLDALGIAHEDGLISDEQVKYPPEKLKDAVAAIAASFPADDVALYLSTLTWQDAEVWGSLAELPEAHTAEIADR
jgi:hypothetical protein